MGILIDIGTTNINQSVNPNLINEYSNQILDIFKKVEKIKIINDKKDSTSWTNVFYFLSTIEIKDITCWDTLENLAIENQLYVTIVDIKTKEKIAYFFDEDEVWLDLKNGLNKDYEEFIFGN